MEPHKCPWNIPRLLLQKILTAIYFRISSAIIRLRFFCWGISPAIPLKNHSTLPLKFLSKPRHGSFSAFSSGNSSVVWDCLQNILKILSVNTLEASAVSTISLKDYFAFLFNKFFGFYYQTFLFFFFLENYFNILFLHFYNWSNDILWKLFCNYFTNFISIFFGFF